VKFVVAPHARADILRQYEYYLVEKDAQAAAERFLAAVRTAVAQVCKQPGIGTPKPLTNRQLVGLRSWPVKGFAELRIYYIVSGDVVRVIRVLHGRRDIDPMLELE
jgi:plasmid stabilization system protein ParE